mmetsp:Transcript_27114/g.78241  ORF Transcript_27114/g.78241 Transcript_27114/m.78241 type:complete len:203 (+) Transcript_27114:1005-1613(+)
MFIIVVAKSVVPLVGRKLAHLSPLGVCCSSDIGIVAAIGTAASPPICRRRLAFVLALVPARHLLLGGGIGLFGLNNSCCGMCLGLGNTTSITGQVTPGCAGGCRSSSIRVSRECAADQILLQLLARGSLDGPEAVRHVLLASLLLELVGPTVLQIILDGLLVLPTVLVGGDADAVVGHPRIAQGAVVPVGLLLPLGGGHGDS